jgi:hypothetical protein
MFPNCVVIYRVLLADFRIWRFRLEKHRFATGVIRPRKLQTDTFVTRVTGAAAQKAGSGSLQTATAPAFPAPRRTPKEGG